MFAELLSTYRRSLDLTNAVAVAAAVASALFVFYWRLRRATDLHYVGIPVFDSRDDDNGIVATLERAHQFHPDTPFALAVPGQQLVVLPVSEIETVKALPEDQLSIKKHHYNQFLGEHSYMGTKADEFDDAMRNVLVRNTPMVLRAFVAEIGYATRVTIGDNLPTWTKITPKAAMARMATVLSGRSFIGLPLSRDEEWIDATVGFTGDVSRAWMKLRFIPHPLRPFVAPFFFRSVLLREREKKRDRDGPAGSGAAGGELLDWLRDQYSSGQPSVKELTRDQLLATFASIYNLTNALTYMVFDLASHPELVEELRAELHDVLVNIPRIVTSPKGLRLTTGHTIPPGFLVMVRAQPINLSPKLYPEPEKFDAFRFSRMREQPGQEMKFQHTSTGNDNINFGHGIWACPGRFFASAQIKVVAAHLIRNFDMRLTPGEKKPVPQYGGLAIFPDAVAQVELRSRTP
ncbi:Cytochrome P450 monooxygenase [Colletotrichum fructicola]|uniref:Cytochrome p450 oxidoreductase n=1 Tax=Colletotrichum fructicola (strain Nara gc5) TaxID=1213859 RepID=L2FPH7_COLFN|nr:Cytochrome P450 monooxygenase [Colletotrichum fructicola]KAE9572550.1 Cytochrome P450 monooxygenase [Colletotrichum fructicola]KAF4416885.1 Cytochrome P450 monooxygenase gliF [Colletotrichum fructicola]KAF4893468.1 Cytochrome P450 monooxygenase gliF [Colletotrichum fructicola]